MLEITPLFVFTMGWRMREIFCHNKESLIKITNLLVGSEYFLFNWKRVNQVFWRSYQKKNHILHVFFLAFQSAKTKSGLAKQEFLK